MKLDSAVFYTNNLNKAIEFYRDALGFKVEYIQEGRFASFIFPNRVKLGIRQKNVNEDREVPGYQTVFISTDNIKVLYDDLRRKRIALYREISTLEGWGTNSQILDPDGNKVVFVKLEK